MKEEQAMREIGAMEAVLETLLHIQDGMVALDPGGTREEDEMEALK